MEKGLGKKMEQEKIDKLTESFVIRFSFICIIAGVLISVFVFPIASAFGIELEVSLKIFLLTLAVSIGVGVVGASIFLILDIVDSKHINGDS